MEVLRAGSTDLPDRPRARGRLLAPLLRATASLRLRLPSAWRRHRLADSALLPALGVLLAALCVIALRPAIPYDESRYLEILREFDPRHQPWLLRLNGEPYADKPPLVFWLAEGLHALGLPLAFALRVLPGIASAGTILVCGALARASIGPRAGSRAAWLQAAMLAPLLHAQVLYVDPLLVLCVWVAVLSWSRGSDRLATLAAAAALWAKGPAALIHLVPFFWASAPARPVSSGLPTIGRALLVIGAALAALAAWALLAAHSGGEAFSTDLLWHQTATRITTGRSHARPVWFYLPVIVVAAWPVSAVFARRAPPLDTAAGEAARVPAMLARLPAAIAVIVLVFSLFPDKQPHYLLPVFPAVALLAAGRLERDARAAVRVRRGALALAGLLFGALLGGVVLRARVFENYGSYGAELARDPRLLLLAALGAAAAAIAFVAVVRSRGRVRGSLALVALAELAVLVPVHYAAGRLLLPRAIGEALAGDGEVASYRTVQGGLYNWLAGKDHIARLASSAELESWLAAHPTGSVVVEDKYEAEIVSLPLERVLRDRMRGAPASVWRRRAASAGPTPRRTSR